MVAGDAGRSAVPVSEWRRRWPLVMAACTGFFFYSLILSYSGLFIGPVGDEFGWTRTQVTAGLSMSSILTTVLSPFVGMMIDRWGARRMALPGIILTAGAVASFGLASGSVAQWLVMWALYALATLLIMSTVWTTAVAGVFHEGRGLAMGLVMSGTALAQIIVPPLGDYLIDLVGWRAAFACMGAGWGAVTFALCFFFLYDAHDDRRRDNAPCEDAAPVLRGLTLHQAFRDAALQRIAASTVLIMLFTTALTVHQIPILVEAGLTRTHAAWLAGLAGVAGLAGKLVTGRLLDRFRPNRIGGVTLSSAAIGFALLLAPLHSPVVIVLAMLINGYAAGCKLQIGAYLTSRYAGAKNFGAIFGVMASLISISGGLGPVFGSIVYDASGDYTFLLVGGILGSLASGALIFGLGPYPEWGADEALCVPALARATPDV